MSLDTANFQTVFEDDFADDSSLSGITWPVRFGDTVPGALTFTNGTLTLTSSAATGWQTVGFLQPPTGPSSGEGYGLYSFTGYANAGQGTGIAFLMWPANNQQLGLNVVNAAGEIDVLESWNGTVNGESTIHYYDPSWPDPSQPDDGQDYNQLPSSIDLTKVHTYTMDWERGSLTFYVDGQQIYQNIANAPLDAADGGTNMVMGAEIINAATGNQPTGSVQLHIVSMSYSAPIASPATTVPASNIVDLPANQDTLVTVSGGMTVYAQPAGSHDTVSAAAGQVTVIGNGDSLWFRGGTGASSLNGGSGSMTVFGGSGGGTYSGGSAGHNILISQAASGANTTLTGGGAGDQIFGSETGSGNDVLSAGYGPATILGGAGNTVINGGITHAAVIFTGGGTTTVDDGNAGQDTVVGGSGTLTVNANNGDDIYGNSSTLIVRGSQTGSDAILGGTGALNVQGQGGNMLVAASEDASIISVGSGAALVFGSAGSTTVLGGSGYLQVVQGTGNMNITEGASLTVYDISKGASGGTDVISNFHAGIDQINLFGYTASQVQTSYSAGSTIISLSDGTKLQLLGVSNAGGSLHVF